MLPGLKFLNNSHLSPTYSSYSVNVAGGKRDSRDKGDCWSKTYAILLSKNSFNSHNKKMPLIRSGNATHSSTHFSFLSL